MNYNVFHPIEDESALARMFNGIMKRLQITRSQCAPQFFAKTKDMSFPYDTMFCDLCRYELWMHGTVEKLYFWRTLIEKYFKEFNGSWKYYAAYHRLECIRLCEGEEDDDNFGDGEEISSDELREFAITDDFYNDGLDIVRDTTAEHLKGFFSDIIAVANIDVYAGLKKYFGSKIMAFKKNEDGSMRPMSMEEHDLDMALGKVSAEDDTKRLQGVVGGLWGIYYMIKECRWDNDNTELMQMIYDSSSAILNLDFSKLDEIWNSFREKYIKEGLE